VTIHPFPAERKKEDDAHEKAESRPSPPAFAELGVTTNFSFLRSGSSPEELAAQAKHFGLAGIGIADRNSVAGVVRAHVVALEIGVKLVPGARLVFADDTPDILAYPRDRAAWGRLTQLLSVGKSHAEKGDCILYLDDLLEWNEGLNLIVMPSDALKPDDLTPLLIRLRQTTHDHAWLAAAMLYRGDDKRRLARLKAISAEAAVPLLATNDVLYHHPDRRALQDVVTCIREHVTLETAGRRLEANAERHLKRAEEIARLFRSIPQAIAETTRFLDQCRFSLEQLRGTEYPEEIRKGFASPQDALVTFSSGPSG
jgi:error-prone DNA polymerase